MEYDLARPGWLGGLSKNHREPGRILQLPCVKILQNFGS
jgi:hypothetical protein